MKKPSTNEMLNAVSLALFDREYVEEKTFCQRCSCEIETCEIICDSCDEDIDLEKGLQR